jgi:hypothetical protein
VTDAVTGAAEAVTRVAVYPLWAVSAVGAVAWWMTWALVDLTPRPSLTVLPR